MKWELNNCIPTALKVHVSVSPSTQSLSSPAKDNQELAFTLLPCNCVTPSSRSFCDLSLTFVGFQPPNLSWALGDIHVLNSRGLFEMYRKGKHRQYPL